jgi:UDP-glucose 4-epimerase
MAILVTGGAGYIGSHMSYALLERGFDVAVIDNLSTGLRKLVPPDARFIDGNAGDIRLIREVIGRHSIDAVIHFAGSVVVPESVANPLAYYENNCSVSRNLIEACVKEGVKDFVFSSTCAVYGIPAENPVNEDTPVSPVSPYGRSKLVTEWILRDAASAHPFRYVTLRYFNVAGADPKGRTGQSTPHAPHLIRRACLAALGKIDHVDIFGTDYPTRDGSGIRDYIHVTDLVAAHVSALEYLRDGGDPMTLNCGYGRGFSVREVIEAISRVSGRAVPARPAARRAGDPPEVVADPSRLKRQFNWVPKYENLDEMIASAYRWEQTL